MQDTEFRCLLLIEKRRYSLASSLVDCDNKIRVKTKVAILKEVNFGKKPSVELNTFGHICLHIWA